MKALLTMQTLILFLLLVGEVLLTEAAAEKGSSANTTSQAQFGRQHMPTPTSKCTGREGHVSPISANSDRIWICKSGQWIPHFIVPYIGTESLPGQSCKHIKDELCAQYLPSGVYWVNVTEKCFGEKETMQVYCDMYTDGGGWSLVWKHSYMEVTNFTANMFYNSSFPKPCTDLASGWCNVPSKLRFQPKEMMIVAYHYSTMVYAYKGTFNRNLDHDWTGATLLGNVRAIIDRCTMPRNGVPTPRQENDLAGMVFDKQINSDSETIYGTRSTYYDRRWHECYLPLSISSSKYRVQMTMAIYVR